MSNLLVRYIKLMIAEALDARVPQQLVKADSEKDNEQNDTKKVDQDVNEFSGVGSIVGYSAPLGADPKLIGRKNNKRKK